MVVIYDGILWLNAGHARQLLQSRPTPHLTLTDEVVRSYHEQMEKGHWRQDSGDPIVLVANGVREGGAHRIAALSFVDPLRSIPLWFRVVRRYPTEPLHPVVSLFLECTHRPRDLSGLAVFQPPDGG